MTAYANGCFVGRESVGDGFNGGLDGGDAGGWGSFRRLRLTPSGAGFGAICDLEVTKGLT